MANIQIIDLFGFLSTILALPFHYTIQIHFFNKFLGFKSKTWKCIFFIIPLVLLNILIYKVQSPLGFVVNDLLWFALLLCLCNGNFVLKLYAAIVPATISLLIYIIFLSFDYRASSYILTLNTSSILDIFILFLINVARESINLILFFLFLNKISDFLSFKERTVDVYQSLYLFIPCLATYSLILIFYFVQAIHIDNKDYYLFSIFPKVYYVVPLVSISLLISIILNAYIFKKMIQVKDIEQKNLLMEQQFKLQINHSKNLESLYSGTRSIKHDMNNHLLCLKSLAQNGNVEEINNYLHTLGQTIEKLDYTIKTGNAISDAIINEKYNIAKMENIKFNCDFILPNELILDSVDLCVVLSNSLDNALEACIKIQDETVNKEISITSYIQDLYLIIEVSNTIVDKLQYNGNKIATTKQDKTNHGIGISSIEMIAKKYNGIVDIIIEKNKFILNIMLKVKDNQ
ncbi:sensor histidine kinase [Clostridium peptidivorans]|uniref:sensor histidine kinase n=1 Tax=Clostridium peptidivorans TaxID=100174 RepID=UPI000BE31128|nr:sensor histidine kinase [Clostridium peptidivorans]